MNESSKKYQTYSYSPSASLNLNLFTIGHPGDQPHAVISLGYELRSRGPPVLGTNALDNKLVWIFYILQKLAKSRVLHWAKDKSLKPTWQHCFLANFLTNLWDNPPKCLSKVSSLYQQVYVKKDLN